MRFERHALDATVACFFFTEQVHQGNRYQTQLVSIYLIHILCSIGVIIFWINLAWRNWHLLGKMWQTVRNSLHQARANIEILLLTTKWLISTMETPLFSLCFHRAWLPISTDLSWVHGHRFGMNFCILDFDAQEEFRTLFLRVSNAVLVQYGVFIAFVCATFENDINWRCTINWTGTTVKLMRPSQAQQILHPSIEILLLVCNRLEVMKKIRGDISQETAVRE